MSRRRFCIIFFKDPLSCSDCGWEILRDVLAIPLQRMGDTKNSDFSLPLLPCIPNAYHSAHGCIGKYMEPFYTMFPVHVCPVMGHMFRHGARDRLRYDHDRDIHTDYKDCTSPSNTGKCDVLMFMMTSSNGDNFRVTGPLWEESTGNRWIPLTEASDAELWCFLWSPPGQSA